MERIQSAIAKARAERATRLPGQDRPEQAAALSPVVATQPATGDDAAAVAARWTALPGFAPGAAHMARHHIVTFAGGREATHFDMLRTRLLQAMRVGGWHRVAITSPGPGCGKSTLALNLAFSLARQPDLRTILCEMDLRRPALARMLGLRDRHHIARVLEGREALAQNAVRCGENLAIATQAAPARNPAELLHGPALAAALDAIEADWAPQVVLCDLPPLFAADDAHAVMGRMDAVLIVAAAGTTTIAEIDRAEREIAAQANVIGVVLNKCRYMPRDYGYDYYG
jgi:Mrp family chromosome partitioning ATPase